jgi:16S rRNA (adenine1518-N6/adenine1519-N6)-dimethyltransferase
VGQKWGQHFLRSQTTVDKILKAAELSLDSVVVEIGPGEGVITLGLCERASRVHAFEVDPLLAGQLQERGLSNLTVHQGDFLKQDPAACLGEDAQKDVVVVANLPYYITAPIMERLFWRRPLRVSRAILMMQHEVAERVTSPATRSAGALTYIVGAHYASEYLFGVPPGCFSPPPKVDSAVICLTPDSSLLTSDSKFYERLVNASFQARRKQLGRSLRAVNPRAPEILTQAGIDSRRRPETLTVQEFWDLARKWPRCE